MSDFFSSSNFGFAIAPKTISIVATAIITKNKTMLSFSFFKTDTGDIEVDNVLNTKIISEADTGNEDVNGSDDSSGVTLTVTTDTGDIEVNDN